MKMFQQPRKLLKFVAACIVLALPNSLALLAEPFYGCYRLASSPVPCGRIPLELFQINQINDARDFIDELRANKTFAYLNQRAIVTRFTQDQMVQILDVYRGFGGNQPVYEDLLWEEEAANTSTTNTTNPFPGRKRRATVVTGQRICQVRNIMQPLITAFNTDNRPLQIVQFSGFSQWVLRQECQTSLSREGKLSRVGLPEIDIACRTIQRSVYLVAIRLDGGILTSADIDVQQVQVESCSSFV